MRFIDRHDAGKQLAAQLTAYHAKPNTIIIGLPRGGVVTAAAVADQLKLPLDIVCPRKIGAPFNPEYAIGAVTETGEAFFEESVLAQLAISPAYLQQSVQQQTAEAKRRIQSYRKGRSERKFKDVTVILIDDGIATGATMKAAIRSVKAQQAKQVIVAVPVIPPDHVDEFTQMVNRLYYLSAPRDFAAVGQFYDHFESTSDAEVVQLLHQYWT